MSASKEKFILRFFPEIMIKGKKAKKQMIDQLINNVHILMRNVDENIKLKNYPDKIEIFYPKELKQKLICILKNTPGIEFVLESLAYDEVCSIDEISQIVHANFAKELQNKSFVVRAKRVGVHSFRSPDIERQVGGYLLSYEKSSRVDLLKAELKINIDLFNNTLNIITSRHKGLGGFPIGSANEAISLISGGFDSCVASYLCIKRGIKTHYIFFNLGGNAHEIGVRQAAFYLWNKFSSSHRVKFICIDFEEVLSELFKSVSKSYLGVMLKRLMILSAANLADKMAIDALITGESVAQVSSQTLRNLNLINSCTKKLILRPLCVSSKQDIIDLAKHIGTANFSATMPEYCGVISQNPVTSGSFKRIEEQNAKFDFKILEKAINNAKISYVDELVENVKSVSKVQVVHECKENEIILDIREQESAAKFENAKVIKLPFYKLKSDFAKLDQSKTYLFYCEKGVLSQLHAQYLIDQKDYKNIKVFRPN